MRRKSIRSVSVLPAIAALVVAAAASTASAQEVNKINLGDTVSGVTEVGVKEVMPFDVVDGTL
ncbi:MAG: hypothetical protein ACYTDX_00305, partial [Planctomycetota bacterium]